MVRLGARTLSRGRLSAAAMHRAVEVLKDYRRLAERHRVDKFVAVATSAVREARNGEDLLERIGREVGIYVRPISGEEEARFIYLAVHHSIHLEDKRVLVLDMGGGSLEVALGRGSEVGYAASEKLGVLRLSERFVTGDPLDAADEKAIEAHVREKMAPHIERITSKGFDCVVGTSGTILALGALAHAEATGRHADVLHHLAVSADSLHATRKRLVRTPLKERARIQGLDPMRADIIPAGAVTLDTLLGSLGAKEILLSEWALREGVLMDYIRTHPRKLARVEEYPDVRRRSVMELAERCLFEQAHAFHVALLATRLFDLTKPMHGMDGTDRSVLEYGALLHDIGHHISHPKHHRHSYYLIRNKELKGFSPLEIDQMACLARYHRRGTPRKRDSELKVLPPAERGKLRTLAGILRIADSLDRGHRQAVRSIDLTTEGETLRIACSGIGNLDLEMWGARRRADLLQKALGFQVSIEAAPARSRSRRHARRAGGAS